MPSLCTMRNLLSFKNLILTNVKTMKMKKYYIYKKVLTYSSGANVVQDYKNKNHNNL